jgi:hypothetical protein
MVVGKEINYNDQYRVSYSYRSCFIQSFEGKSPIKTVSNKEHSKDKGNAFVEIIIVVNKITDTMKG